MSPPRAFVDSLQAAGRYSFRKEEVTSGSEEAISSALRRMVQAGRLVSPKRGFYVIVPIEYRIAGSPPPAWFIDELMRFLDRPYYVGLLTAAAIYGATQQQAQEFQVITDMPVRPIMVGRASIRFFTKRHIERALVEKRKTETGSMSISAPEMTAFDLIRYAKSAGHLSNVAAVLMELAAHMRSKVLLDVVRRDGELSTSQRLGYLLDRMGARRLSEPLAIWVKTQRPLPVALRPDKPHRDISYDPRWLVYPNETIEVDE